MCRYPEALPVYLSLSASGARTVRSDAGRKGDAGNGATGVPPLSEIWTTAWSAGSVRKAVQNTLSQI